jgi:hypothetical protein
VGRPDPLAATLSARLDDLGARVALKLRIAVRRGVTAMADRYNDGQHWPHPVARRGFPPPALRALVDDE